MSKKKKKQVTTMEVKEDFFDEIDYYVSSILLELSNPVAFSSDSPCLHKWGRTKKRSSSVSLKSPLIKSLPCMASTSSSSCLTGEANKTDPQSLRQIKKGLEEEFSTTKQRSKPKIITSQTNASLLEAEMCLSRAQVGLLAHQPIGDYQNLRHLQPSICVDRTANVRGVETASSLHQARVDLFERRRGFDLNRPAEEEGYRIDAMVGFQIMANRAQAAAQARQRRLGLIRSKKLFSRFYSPYQFK